MSEGPIARTNIFAGSVPPIMKPPIITLSPVFTIKKGGLPPRPRVLRPVIVGWNASAPGDRSMVPSQSCSVDSR